VTQKQQARKHESTKSKKGENMIRLEQRLDDALEHLIHTTIGCCISVHRALGPGLLESIYRKAICLELGACGLSFETEKMIPVTYREVLLCRQRLDLVVDQKLVLEIKSVERLAPVHHAQVRSYLRASGMRVGLLINFNVPLLPDGIRRIVC
jgi:GxxExxY protein